MPIGNVHYLNINIAVTTDKWTTISTSRMAQTWESRMYSLSQEY